MKPLFLYNPSDLNAKIPGGVQLCTQEFLKILTEMDPKLLKFEVRTSKSIWFRILYRLKLDDYQNYNINFYKKELKEVILKNKISHVFINKAELIRFSKVIKQIESPNKPNVIIMSHGNETGDFLDEATGVNSKSKRFLKYTSKIKLGLNIYTESWFRKRFVDLVCTISEEERVLENWLGINKTFFIPRLVDNSINYKRNPIIGRYGYVGTLNHGPNLNALTQLFDVLTEKKFKQEIRIVGQPTTIGYELERTYPFISYVGALSDEELTKEVANWSFFLNPIFNFARGSSMKLSKAISWEIPIITTKSGTRGYIFSEGNLIVTDDNATIFATAMQEYATYPNYGHLEAEVKSIKNNNITAAAISKQLIKALI